MRIVLLQDDFPPESRGGAGNLVATLALELKRQGHDVTVIAATQNRATVGKSVWGGILVYRIYSDYHERWRAYRSLYNFSTVREIKKLLRQLSPEVVHAHNVHYHLSYWSLVLAKRHAKKVVLTAHDEMLFHYGKFYECIGRADYTVHWWQIVRRFKRRWNPLRNIFIRRTMRRVKIVSLSHAHQQALRDNGYDSTVIYNGIDPASWPATASAIEAFKQTYALDSGKVVLFAGRISNLKGADVTRQAMELVQKEIPNAKLLVAGATGHLSFATYTGWLTSTEMQAAYGASDVVLFPSIYFDPFGLVNLEAGASSKPVVATCFGGAPEIILDGNTGYIVDPRDTQLFAKRICELLLDPTKAKRLGAAGHERVLTYFTAERMAKEYIALFALLV